MADGTNQSRYVKLTKDQAPVEDIRPGELNQPIEVPQVLFFPCLAHFITTFTLFVIEGVKTLAD